MLLGQRADGLGVVADEGRLDERVFDKLFEQLEHDFAVAPVVLEFDLVHDGERLELFFARLVVDRLAECLGHKFVDAGAAPFGLEVDLSAVAAGDDRTADGPRRIDHERAGEIGHRVVGAVCLVDLEHHELGVVRVVDAFVAECLADLVNPVDAADEGALEVEFDRDAQQHVFVEGVDVGAERTRGSAAVGVLEDRRLDLDEVVTVESRPQGLQDFGLSPDVFAGFGTDDQVDITHPAARFITQRIVFVGERSHRLGGHTPGTGLDRKLAAAAGDDFTGDAEMVADVDEGLESRQRFFADVGQGQHGLEFGAVALPQPGKTKFAGVAQENHPSRDRDNFTGLDVRAEGFGVIRVDDLAKRMSAVDNNRIGLLTAVDQLLALFAAYLHLFGKCALALGNLFTHRDQA